MTDLTSDLASLKIQREEDPNRPKWGKIVLFGALALGAASAAAFVGYPALEARVFKTEVAVTEISTVSPAQASITVTSTGYVVPQTISKVGAKLAGRVSKVLVKEGSVVKAGDVLVELEATDQRELDRGGRIARHGRAGAGRDSARATSPSCSSSRRASETSSKKVRSERPRSTTSKAKQSRPSRP